MVTHEADMDAFCTVRLSPPVLVGGRQVESLDMMTGAGFKDITYSGIPTDLIRKLQLPVDDPNRIK